MGECFKRIAAGQGLVLEKAHSLGQEGVGKGDGVYGLKVIFGLFGSKVVGHDGARSCERSNSPLSSYCPFS